MTCFFQASSQTSWWLEVDWQSHLGISPQKYRSSWSHSGPHQHLSGPPSGRGPCCSMGRLVRSPGDLCNCVPCHGVPSKDESEDFQDCGHANEVDLWRGGNTSKTEKRKATRQPIQLKYFTGSILRRRNFVLSWERTQTDLQLTNNLGPVIICCLGVGVRGRA